MQWAPQFPYEPSEQMHKVEPLFWHSLKSAKNVYYFVFLIQMALQYVVLGPRLKIIISNFILPESKRNELKYSLKIAFMFLSIIVNWQVPNLSILLVIWKKATVLDGPWSAT